MKITQLKRLIEENKLSDNILFFIIKGANSNKSFLAEQYLKQIACNKQLHLTSVDTYKQADSECDLFETASSREIEPIRYIQTDTFKVDNPSIINEDKLIIITKELIIDETLPSEVIEFVDKQTVEFPEISEWQILDYMVSKAEGLNADTAKLFYKRYNGNLYKIDNELNKISLFSPREQVFLIEQIEKEEAYEDIPQDAIFAISNALAVKDIKALSTIYQYKDLLIKPKTGEMGFIGLLYKTFRNLILVKTTPNPTPETTGLKQNQIYAIQSKPMAYSQSQLLQIFDLISDMDRKIKSGEIDMSYVVDYLIIKIFMI